MNGFIIWFGFALMGAILLSRHNKAGTGFLLGLLFGPFGALFAALLRKKQLRQLTQTENTSPKLVELILSRKKYPK